MANYLCYPLMEGQEYEVVRLKVATGVTLRPGDIVLAETVDTGITDNLEVYASTPVSDYTSDKPCIVINQGFEKTSDGRRIEGNPDYSTYSFTAGDVITAIRLNKGQRYQISDDCIDVSTTLAAGVKLIPQNADYDLLSAASAGSSAVSLNIDARNSIGIGGNMGMTYLDTSIARVE